jgi:predicted nuclease of restriction endonuclease-like (RecB) superfamily
MTDSLQLPTGYQELLNEIKERIRSAQVQAALSVNRELVLLYWSIGRDLSRRFENEGWGTKINQRLAEDLQAAFPGVEGFSPRNLRYMRAFAEAWPEPAILQQLVAKLPWGHNLRVLDRIQDRPTREWYLRAALEHGWSRNVLVHMISGQLHEREGKALTNFQRTLPPPGSDMAEQILRDPYNFDFLTLAEPFAERELEKGSSRIFGTCCLNSAAGSLLSEVRYPFWWTAIPSMSTCFSTMSDCTPTSRSSSRRVSSSPNTPAS